MKITVPETVADWNDRGADYLPGLIGLKIIKVETDEVIASFEAVRKISSWNGFLHAGAVVSLADTCCGYGALKCLPEGADGFTTVELKSNFLGTAHDGVVVCTARPLHLGRTTQVWDAEVRAEGATRTLAHFRCTQVILWPRG
jgi:uncharacterized protein (TIGR00369 family)